MHCDLLWEEGELSFVCFLFCFVLFFLIEKVQKRKQNGRNLPQLCPAFGLWAVSKAT